jgi:hypothetical protein
MIMELDFCDDNGNDNNKNNAKNCEIILILW